MGSWTVCNATLENAVSTSFLSLVCSKKKERTSQANAVTNSQGGPSVEWRHHLPPSQLARRRRVRPRRLRRVLLSDYGPCYSLQQAGRTATVSSPRTPLDALSNLIFFSCRSIIRILFMVPIYSLVAWLSIYFYHYAVYFEVLGDCYEAFCISAFFALLCHYIAPDLHSQKDYFRGVQPKPWLLPVSWFSFCCGGQRGIWRNAKNGLTWFNVRLREALVARSCSRLTRTDYLGWCLPILRYARLNDHRCGSQRGGQPVLPGLAQPGICARLGMSPLNTQDAH